MNQPLDTIKKFDGAYAWMLMFIGILGYDLYAITSGKAETMSSALWRNLQHPVKSLIPILVWGAVTHHLFGNRNARNSYKVSSTVIRTKISRKKGE